ncbi:coatomer protein gamma 2 subunit [Emiliania huxleyi CCMP1516]|uniref:Coatomer subunit gamma n=2 Tax=Emiliania huxleyi TaxID=2903 RepID=A0A0D3KYD7_EMIH1|nr:coatomer protein gamma 2 subunit [Emiliania huxleyi CCMP1516]EOD40772.1 coatomer protein gamma 2 subunit [Emiliania huxleyi CCMP1516]|eukprot:XP_005793201.1 coatomer protein gamma 2 subunit [Emiliania huxleyi CCMP1516]
MAMATGGSSDLTAQGAQWLQGAKEAVMQMTKGEKKDEDESYSPFQSLQKAAVLQECRCFNDREINPRKCISILTKILWLLAQGEKLTALETTEIFFGVTKLLMHKDQQLRRLLYLVLKELKPSPEEVIIVCATLTKDMNSKVDLNRANALRVLGAIIARTDPTMLAQIERHLKQALVDKNCFVAASALVSGIHLMHVNPEVVRRWVNEVQTALASDNPSVQYHALALLHQIKRQDRLAVSKVVASLTRTPLKSPLAHCLLIRFAKAMMEDGGSERDRALFDFLEASLRHRSDMVIYEAATAICSLTSVAQRELSPSITVLQLFLCSPKPACRFSAVRTLNKIAMAHPMAVTPCNMDMEGLINDSNRSIATLAITTLLKTGSESGVERLMKQITSFMSEIADDFKIVVVDAIRAMCLKFPQKHRLLMTFLANVLREEGGFQYKKAIVDTLLSIIARVPEAKEAGLSHLCEFIEDCEFTLLSTQILYLLGVEGPSTQEPSKYIRFIYNRVVLENATVRASAVSALAKFGISIAYLRPSITVLLQRCLYDNDDEVRDRAIFFVTLLTGLDSGATLAGKSAQSLLLEPLPVPLAALEASCREYLAAPTERPLSIDDADLLSRMPEFVHVGARFTSSKRVPLSEVGTEYEVVCTKHLYASHLILAFQLNNTLEDQLLSSVTVALDLAAVPGLALETHVPCASLPFGQPGTAYACLRRLEGVPVGTIPCTLKFVVKDVDPATGPTDDEPGYEDEYQLEELEVCAADFMKRVAVLDFRAAWESVGNGCEVVETFSLSYNSIRQAMEAVIDFLGMSPCENSAAAPDDVTKLTVLLSGVFLGGMQVFAIVNLRADSNRAVGMRLTVRSSDMTVSQFVASSVA